MKRLICILIAGLLLMSVAACAKRSADGVQDMQGNKEMPYSIFVENGEYFLDFGDGCTSSNDNGSKEDIELVRIVRFSTVQEMINDIKTGNFSAEEMDIIKGFRKNEEGLVQICNLSSLYSATYPSTFTSQSIAWVGTGYYIDITTGENGPEALLVFKSQERFEYDIDFYRNFEEQRRITVTSVSSDLERNATVYEYLNYAGKESKAYFYVIGEGDDALYIWEQYSAEEGYSTPNEIAVWGQEQGRYFKVIISNLQDRPSVEWLSQFGIRKYVETEVA